MTQAQEGAAKPGPVLQPVSVLAKVGGRDGLDQRSGWGPVSTHLPIFCHHLFSGPLNSDTSVSHFHAVAPSGRHGAVWIEPEEPPFFPEGQLVAAAE